MDNRTLKIFTACALGAGMGSLVALEMNHYFWWVGMLVGGLVGYVAYDVVRLLAAIPDAWQDTTSWKLSQETKDGWKATASVVVYISLWIIAGGFLSALLPDRIHKNMGNDMAGLTLLVSVVASFVLPIVLSHLVPRFRRAMNEYTYTGWKELRHILLHLNPITICLWYLPQGIVLVIKLVLVNIPQWVGICGKFLWNLFLLIHSDLRLLCGLDAALGSCIGYFAGNALIGALVGGVFGVINYEIVSKHILKVVPVRNEN